MFSYALLGQNFGLHQTMEPARNSAYPSRSVASIISRKLGARPLAL